MMSPYIYIYREEDEKVQHVQNLLAQATREYVTTSFKTPLKEHLKTPKHGEILY